MKLSLIFVCLVATILVGNIEAQFPFFPPFGLMGLMGFPFFGLMGGGLFGRGLLGGGLLGRRFGRDIGNDPSRDITRRDIASDISREVTRRDVDSHIVETGVVSENKTVCSLSSVTNVLSCKSGTRDEHNIDCELIPRVEKFKGLKLRLTDLVVEPELVGSVGMFRLVSTESAGKWTFVHPVDGTNEFVYVYSEPHVKKPGFIVRDRECFAQFVRLAADVPKERFTIIVSINE